MKKKKRSRGKPNGKELSPPHPEAMRALRLIQTHRAVLENTARLERWDDGGFRIQFTMEVALPSRSRTAGVSDTGVRAEEQVLLHFPPSYPLRAPGIFLRPDFNKLLPHLNPMPNSVEGDLVTPCVSEGSLDELLHQPGEGLSEILNHLSEWLGKAAADDLIDPHQGWEPVRRDEILGWIIFDAGKMRKVFATHPEGGAIVYSCRYAQNQSTGHYPMAQVADGALFQMRPARVRELLAFKSRHQDVDIGTSLVVFVWPDISSPQAEDSPAQTYLPDNVTRLDELIARADDYGCGTYLRSHLGGLEWACINSHPHPAPFPVFVVLCALRPYRLIGEDSKLELIPYAIECRFEQVLMSSASPNFRLSPGSDVKPMGHRHALTPELLRQMSEAKEPSSKGPIVQLGCGSVGSKIVMHLARSGNGPFLLCDNRFFSPHNAARHALTGHPELPGQRKALLLAWEVQRLKHSVTTDFADIVDRCHAIKQGKDHFPSDARLIIDATGSIPVREALASLSPAQLPGRFVHTGLYASGEVGLMAIEGPERNPNVGDLVVRFWNEQIDDLELSARLANASNSLQRQSVGQGCGSYTMIMPDTRLSVFSAGIAERARQFLQETPEKGEISIGILDKNKMGVRWRHISLGNTVVLKKDGWEVRLLEGVTEQMDREAREYGMLETGGVLIGRISVLQRRFIISSILEAPPDSERSPNQFVLGVRGLKERVLDAWSKSGKTLTYAGIWHSHPRGGGPSTQDTKTLLEMRKHRLGAPCLSLVWTPEGFQLLIDDGRTAAM